jgi:NAD(P)-dependent dehydrogenase (short-subunit alcohol dehydrogenase family)
MKLSGKTAIVTGAGGSIGRAIAVKLAAEGASVAAVDINLETAEETATIIRDAGGKALALQTDVCDRATITDMVDQVLERFAHIDILINTAGGSARKECSLFHKSKAEVLDRIIDINLKGPLFCTRAIIEHMVNRKQGKIINIGSIVGVQGLEWVVDYSAAKGGIIAFTKALAKEVGPYGINVNCVSPGLVPRPDENPERAQRSNYLGKVCKPEDVAELVLFLATDSADYITGQNYIIDGGRSLGMKGS